MEDPQDTVDDRAVIDRGTADLARMGFRGEQGLDPLPLAVGQFIAPHAQPSVKTHLHD